MSDEERVARRDAASGRTPPLSEQDLDELSGGADVVSPEPGGRAEFSARVAERTAALRERKAALRQRQEELRARARERRGQRAVGALDEEERDASRLAGPADGRAFPGERPLAAAGIALVIGVVIGWLCGRR